jgi:hypothetical protein
LKSGNTRFKGEGRERSSLGGREMVSNMSEDDDEARVGSGDEEEDEDGRP